LTLIDHWVRRSEAVMAMGSEAVMAIGSVRLLTGDFLCISLWVTP